MNSKIIVTGSIGFIGAALCIKLLERGNTIIGIDNHNDYYDPNIKEARLERLKKYQNYLHYKMDLCDNEHLEDIFKKYIDIDWWKDFSCKDEINIDDVLVMKDNIGVMSVNEDMSLYIFKSEDLCGLLEDYVFDLELKVKGVK